VLTEKTQQLEAKHKNGVAYKNYGELVSVYINFVDKSWWL